MATIRLHDSRSRELLELVPRADGHIGIHACGPTVYVATHTSAVLGLQNLAEHGSTAGAEVLELLDEREAVRATGNYAAADRLRDELRARGWEVRDGPDGPELVRIEQ